MPLLSAHPPLVLALAASALVAVSAAPASAAAVDGNVHSGSSMVGDNGTCTVVGGPAADDRVFTHKSGKVTASASGAVTGSDPGTSMVAAGAQSQSDTSGRAVARKGAFRKLDIDAHHLVEATNDSAFDCGFTAVADSQAGADVHVARRGEIRIDWQSNGPRVAEIVVTGPGGTEVLRKNPSKKNGSATIKVRKGDYYFFVQFYTTAKESEAPVGGAKIRDIFYSLDAVYSR